MGKKLPDNFPKIVCLCGSTKFTKAYRQAEFDETLKGNIVLTIHCNTKIDSIFLNMPKDELDRIKAQLFLLHLRQIDLANEVLVLNVGGYIGESTGSEIEYAKSKNKLIRYLEGK